MGLWNWIKKNTTTIVATVAAAVVTGGTSLVIQAAAIGGAFLVGSAMDADRQQKEQEDKKLSLAGKAGDAVRGQVNDLQDRRNKVVQESEDLIKEMQKHKSKLNDPNTTPEEKDLAKKMIPIIQNQLDEKSREISNYDKKIEDRVEKFLAQDPHKNGEPLKGNLKGEWSYHWSSYRIIYEIKQNKLLILIVEVGDRKNIYQKLGRKSR